MTPDEVRERVERIRRLSGDDAEAAHSAEDQLYQDLVEAIATGECDEPLAAALVAIETADFDFSRGCR